MRIVLAFNNENNKNVLFITDNFKLHNLSEAIQLTKKQQLNNVHVVSRKNGSYLRSHHNKTTNDNLERIALTLSETELFCSNYPILSIESKLKEFEKIRQENIKVVSTIVLQDDYKGRVKYFNSSKTKNDVISHIAKHRKTVIDAAEKLGINKYFLGAILIDEYCRMEWDDTKLIVELLLNYGGSKYSDVSVGIAQVKIETARSLIEKEYFIPKESEDWPNLSRKTLYPYVEKYSVYFSAAYIKYLIDFWKEKGFDISDMLENIGYYYSVRKERWQNDKRLKNYSRSIQIANEFYPIAKNILR